jgi:hypothetical protein
MVLRILLLCRLLTLGLALAIVRAEIIDRVVIVAGGEVITELQLEEELQVTAFLNQAPASADTEARRAAADRLIQQSLVTREVELSRYPEPTDASVQAALNRVQAAYETPSALEKALQQYGLTAETLKRHLKMQITTMRFIGFRFRPELVISDTDLQRRYAQEVETWKAEHPQSPVPSFNKSKDSLRNALIEERTDEALNRWLQETRRQMRIIYLDRTLEQRTP